MTPTMTSQPPHKTCRAACRARPVVSGVVVATGVAICGVPVGGAAYADVAGLRVSYHVSGNSPAAEYISYQTDTGQQHEANVRLPWSAQFTAPANQVLVLSAQGPGSITCTISVNNLPVSHITATGQPARAACSH
jgi:hypothetical protein